MYYYSATKINELLNYSSWGNLRRTGEKEDPKLSFSTYMKATTAYNATHSEIT